MMRSALAGSAREVDYNMLYQSGISIGATLTATLTANKIAMQSGVK